MADRKPILCLDFDGVLHSYVSGWQGADFIPDPPVPGAMHFLFEASIVFDLCIFSSRSHQEGGINAMRNWLRFWMRKELGKEEEHRMWQERAIDFPKEKPAAMVTLDDRAITFDGTWPSMETLLAFKPWNKK